MPSKTGGQTPGRQDARDKPHGAKGRLRVKQVRSTSGRPELHRRTLRALGLRYHQQVVVVHDSPAIRGMLFQVRHLVEVTPAGAR